MRINESLRDMRQPKPPSDRRLCGMGLLIHPVLGTAETYDRLYSWCCDCDAETNIINQEVKETSSMTHAEIRTTISWALINMDRADRKLELSEHESIPSVAKMLKEDSAVLYRSAVLTLKDAASQLD
jgi:hypothetical protein